VRGKEKAAPLTRSKVKRPDDLVRNIRKPSKHRDYPKSFQNIALVKNYIRNKTHLRKFASGTKVSQ